MFEVGSAASEATATSVPVAAPGAVGVNVTVKVTLWSGAIVVGRAGPFSEKWAPLTLACEIVVGDPPVLVSTSDKVALLPTGVPPKPRLALLTESTPILFEECPNSP